LQQFGLQRHLSAFLVLLVSGEVKDGGNGALEGCKENKDGGGCCSGCGGSDEICEGDSGAIYLPAVVAANSHLN
jgi:hypothetical protein